MVKESWGNLIKVREARTTGVVVVVVNVTRPAATSCLPAAASIAVAAALQLG
jgi:hypothetical protein